MLETHHRETHVQSFNTDSARARHHNNALAIPCFARCLSRYVSEFGSVEVKVLGARASWRKETLRR